MSKPNNTKSLDDFNRGLETQNTAPDVEFTNGDSVELAFMRMRIQRLVDEDQRRSKAR